MSSYHWREPTHLLSRVSHKVVAGEVLIPNMVRIRVSNKQQQESKSLIASCFFVLCLSYGFRQPDRTRLPRIYAEMMPLVACYCTSIGTWGPLSQWFQGQTYVCTQTATFVYLDVHCCSSLWPRHATMRCTGHDKVSVAWQLQGTRRASRSSD